MRGLAFKSNKNSKSMTNINIFNRQQNKRIKLIRLINNYTDQSRKSHAYKRRYWNLARKIEFFEKNHDELFTDSLNTIAFESLIDFIKTEYNYRPSTIKSFSGGLSKIINYARQQGYKVDDSFKDVRLIDEESTSIYLSESEIERIYNLKIKEQNVLAIKNRFLIGCCTGLRFSDYSKLSSDNFAADSINVKTQKTGAKVIIPVHWIVIEILESYHGILPP